jgi:hypothetical protein
MNDQASNKDILSAVKGGVIIWLDLNLLQFILLYTYTVDKVFSFGKVMVNENSVWFSHVVGSTVSLICLLLLYADMTKAGWIVTVLLAVLQTSGALGFCSAMKLYDCITSGGDCCSIGRALNRIRKRKNV